MSSTSLPARFLVRRFTLGSGPLKRRSDRVEFLSRILLVLALLMAMPLAVAVGTAVADGLDAATRHQAQTRIEERATLLHDAATEPAEGSMQVPTSATWLGPDGTAHVGTVPAAPGSRAGASIAIWVDRSGRPVQRPAAAAVVEQALVAGAVTFLGIVVAGLSLHLIVLGLLARRRSRRWEAGWTSVEPLWMSRFT